jgi:hypothetical protein
MSPIDSQDAKVIVDEMERRARDSKPPHPTGDQPVVINEKTTRFSWGAVGAIVAIAGFAVTAAGIARGADAKSDKALEKTADHEARIVRLEEQRKADAALMTEVRDALKKNADALQKVEVELAKKK